MEPPRTLASMAVLLAVLSTPAAAQIISTSLPTSKATGAKRDRFSAHVMATPLAQWDYKEVYFLDVDLSSLRGVISGKPYSDFMLAGEVAVALGAGPWSVTAGGWYNGMGRHDFDFRGALSFPSFVDCDIALCGPLTAKVPMKLTLAEGHVGIFFKAVGLQLGAVRTHQQVSDQFLHPEWTLFFGFDAKPLTFDPYDFDLNILPSDRRPGRETPELLFDVTTTDVTVFGVFRKGGRRWGVSFGLGVYFKEGITQGSPLRFADDQAVLSAFGTGNVTLYKGLGIDVSFWQIGPTKPYAGFKADVEQSVAPLPLTLPSRDSQSRWTIGLGFSF